MITAMIAIEKKIYRLKNGGKWIVRRPLDSETSKSLKFVYATLALFVLLRIVMMFSFPLLDPTEARYAEIARKMLETGDWITPQFDYGVPFWGKPPLHTWLSAAGMAVFGPGQFGARVFIFGAALGVLGLTYEFARHQIGRLSAAVTAAVLMGSVLFFGASAFVMTDMAMTLGTTISMVSFFKCISHQKESTFWGNLFFAGLAVGLLAKGPVALVLTLLPIGLWVLTGRRWRALGRLSWVSGVLLLLVLTVPWYLAAELKTPGFLRYFLIGEHFERFVVSGWQGDLYGSGHARAKGTIWLFWLVAFLPWSFFAATLLPRFRQIMASVNSDTRGLRSYLLFWTISPMIMFTPAANILPAYVLPGFPAAAMLLVVFWSDAWGAPSIRVKTWFAASVTAVMLLFAAISAVALISPVTVNIPSQQALIAQLNKMSPGTTLTLWKDRSYSAEFYSGGNTRVTTDPELSVLNANNIRDAVAVQPRYLPQVTEITESGRFENLGRFGRYDLFIEHAESAGEP